MSDKRNLEDEFNIRNRIWSINSKMFDLFLQLSFGLIASNWALINSKLSTRDQQAFLVLSIVLALISLIVAPMITWLLTKDISDAYKDTSKATVNLDKETRTKCHIDFLKKVRLITLTLSVIIFTGVSTIIIYKQFTKTSYTRLK